MGKRDRLVGLYAHELRTRCAQAPDIDLLKRIVAGCGPSVYDREKALFDPRRPGERAALRRNFMVRKLGLPDGGALDDALQIALETYAPDTQPRYRAVLHYLLVRQFGKEDRFA
ncbi:DUF2853 family protein [Profundibacterium mesophilum]|uniref:DUF2853 family protein n=1 Tax=Profundibacterium mesophilum KAUST100406-0324 TaxID=1037889 RepID=A0A921NRD7_9RHOB|nr:DUF2853 family protein [Profundibacterium mesophilum]KAF0676295.1 hypothetical protein PMES_01026 [Profundibacterium mesophilum KAUST100406-0324]